MKTKLNKLFITILSITFLLLFSIGCITVSAQNDTSDNVSLNLSNEENSVLAVSPTYITVNPSYLSMQVGQTYVINVTIFPADATDKTITWSSTNTNVAYIESSSNTSCTIRAVSVGGTAIIATASNGLVAQCSVTVFPPTATQYPEILNGRYYGIKNAASQHFVTATGLISGTVRQSAESTSVYQDWKIVQGNGNYYKIYSNAHDAYLGMNSSYNIVLDQTGSTLHYNWIAHKLNDGSFAFYNAQYPTMRLSAQNTISGSELKGLSQNIYYYRWRLTNPFIEGVDYIHINRGYHTNTITVRAIDLTSEGFLSSVGEVVNIWNNISNYLNISKTENSNCTITLKNLNDSQNQNTFGWYVAYPRGEYGRATSFNIDIYIDNIIRKYPYTQYSQAEVKTAVKHVIAHELGHAFGLEDDPTGLPSIMVCGDDFLEQGFVPYPVDVYGAEEYYLD